MFPLQKTIDSDVLNVGWLWHAFYSVNKTSPVRLSFSFTCRNSCPTTATHNSSRSKHATASENMHIAWTMLQMKANVSYNFAAAFCFQGDNYQQMSQSNSSSGQCMAFVTWVQARRRLVAGVSVRREWRCKSGQNRLRAGQVGVFEWVCVWWHGGDPGDSGCQDGVCVSDIVILCLDCATWLWISFNRPPLPAGPERLIAFFYSSIHKKKKNHWRYLIPHLLFDF